MRILDGPDLFHLEQERAGRPMHTLKVAVLGRPVPRAAFDTWVRDRVVHVDPLRSRLDPVPFFHPVWVDADELDLSYHVQHVELPPPGGEEELCALLGRLCGGPVLDRSRPLWRMWHVAGLSSGRDAVVIQVHHAVADGHASVAIWNELADAAGSSASADRDAVAAPWRRALSDVVRLPSQCWRFGAYTRRAGQSRRAGEPEVTRAFLGPVTRFNGEPEPDRRCAFVTLDLARLRAVRVETGATITEIFASLAGGAVRRFLEARGDVLDAGLTATVPAALPDRRSRFGNSVTTLYVALHSDIADPLARLGAVRKSVAATRRATERDPRLLADWQRYPRLNGTVIRLMELAEKRAGRPAYNLTVSSVRGPDPFELAGAPVEQLRSIGPLVGRFGLNLTAWSYGSDLTVGIQAYASAGDDLAELGPLLHDELDQLEHHVACPSRGAP
jgi:WS/DGAT/MGAT family acyltransferase